MHCQVVNRQVPPRGSAISTVTATHNATWAEVLIDPAMVPVWICLSVACIVCCVVCWCAQCECFKWRRKKGEDRPLLSGGDDPWDSDGLVQIGMPGREFVRISTLPPSPAC